MPIFLDTNILIYLFDETSEFHEWSKKAFLKAKIAGPVLISDIVYSEFSVAFSSVSETEQAIQELALERLQFSNDALFRAGKVFAQYKKGGGTKTNVLSDFLIGAQVEVSDGKLVTANSKDFSRYFPDMVIESP